jgi:hypothetical protein
MKSITLLGLAAAVALSGCVAYPVDRFHERDGRGGYHDGDRRDNLRDDRRRDRDHDHFHDGRADG